MVWMFQVHKRFICPYVSHLFSVSYVARMKKSSFKVQKNLQNRKIMPIFAVRNNNQKVLWNETRQSKE